MTCTTAVRYDVREDVLTGWLKKEFGDRVSPDGLVAWSCTVISAGHDSSWQVTAPREITCEEQHQLKLDSLPKRTPTFGSRKGSG